MVFIGALFICTVAFAQTINVNWKIDDTTYATNTCEYGGTLTVPTPPTKYGYTFQGWDAGYVELAYIESTGTQYIDTGVYPNSNTRIKTKFINKNPSTAAKVYFGVKNINSDLFQHFTINQNLMFEYGSQQITGITVSSGDILEYDWNKNTVTYSINNIKQSDIVFTPQNFSSSLSMFFFSRNTPNNYGASMMVYYLQIYDNDVLVRDFIPVLDSSGIPYMYDKVEEKFYYNAGTGDFIAGPVVSE